MSSLFVLTFMFSTPAFCLGLLNPQWVGQGTRKRATALYGGLMAVSFLLLGVTGSKPPQEVSSGLPASTELAEFRVSAPLC
jgi:hypothetical protein